VVFLTTPVRRIFDKLVAKGYRVAVAEQTEDPKKVKGLVKREIVRVVTPGTLISSSLLSDKKHNFFVAISKVGSLFGLAVLEVTTADFRVQSLRANRSSLMNYIAYACRIFNFIFLSGKIWASFCGNETLTLTS